MRKVLTWAAFAFFVYWIATDPGGAASVIDGVLNWLKSAGHYVSKL